MNFQQKAISVRAAVTDTNNSVNNTDVYNELLLEAIEQTAPASTTQLVETEVYAVGINSIPEGYYSVSLILGPTFTGTIQGVSFSANTVINMTAKNVLGTINFEVTAGTLTAIKLVN